MSNFIKNNEVANNNNGKFAAKMAALGLSLTMAFAAANANAEPVSAWEDAGTQPSWTETQKGTVTTTPEVTTTTPDTSTTTVTTTPNTTVTTVTTRPNIKTGNEEAGENGKAAAAASILATLSVAGVVAYISRKFKKNSKEEL